MYTFPPEPVLPSICSDATGMSVRWATYGTEEMRKSVRKLYTDPPPHPPTTAHGTVCFAPLRVWLCNTAPAAHEGASQLANALGTRLGCEKSAERTLASKSHPEPNC